MRLKQLTRAGRLALALGTLVGVFLVAAPAVDHSTAYAQVQTPAAPPPAASPAPAAAPVTPPACDAKTLEKCTVNSGDTAWMLTAVALVLMMTIPGLGLGHDEHVGLVDGLPAANR